ncbi:AI-2E family transporter [Parabacteroides sp. PF5-9]|uniref:AI-2E family transporter n=1 Tax=Parabacteroides sp. PF5-9 TaxID=1742404 RepID=UPI002474D3A2|nr:AI-2E family transporter [Parabacteroides sp. PF5-9]MDH6358821.1 putative PurR-regulated permease PerM [Parabacteroides sp. PF5-9]
MNSLFERPFTFDRVMRILFGGVAIVIAVYLIALLRNALLPFCIAWLLAYLMQPIVKFFQYKLRFKSRILSIMAVLLSLLLFISLVVAMVLPSIAQEAERTLELIRKYNLGSSYIPLIPEAWIEYIQMNVDFNQILELLSRENILNALRQIAPKLWSLLSNTFSILFSVTIIFVILLYFIFILLDYEKIANGWKKLIPTKYRPFVEGLADDMETSMNRYFRGQSLIAFCVGILFAIGFKIINFPLAVTLGLFIGVLNLIPYLQTIGIIPMIILSLFRSAETGQNFWLIFGSALVVLVIVQVIQDLFLTPKIMGKAMGLNPALILLSLSIWGTLLGFIGLIIALPLTTLCLSYYKRFILMEEEDEKNSPTVALPSTEIEENREPPA